MKSFFSIFTLLLLILLDLSASAKVSIIGPVPSYKIKTIVLDAGHGGHDSGCKGSSSYEKHIALNIVLKLGKYIEDNYPDVKIIYTRKTDVFIELNERANIANKAKADLFISVHCNANDNRSAYGTETFVMGLHRSDANLSVAKRENSAILLEDDYQSKYDYDPNSPAAHILFTLYANSYLDQSISLATKIEDEFSERAKRNSRGVKQAGFLVLYKTAMPSVLVESGFLTNRNEEEFLRSDYGQDLVASAIFRAFRSYKEEMEINALPSIANDKSLPDNSDKELLASTKNISTVKTIPANSATETKTDAIEFRIQFMATDKNINLKAAPYSNLKDIHTEDIGKGMKRYFSGKYYSPDDARSALRSVQSKGFKDAFLTAYKNGQRINIVDALNSFK